jgi:DNA-binding MarR family transcriptional regulator
MPAVRPALDSDLGWMLGVVFRAYVKIVDAVFIHLPGGPRGYQVLTATVSEAPQSQGALAQRLGVDKSVMTYLVDELEEAGLIAREPNPADRRGKLLTATDHGLRTLADIQTRLEHAERHVLSGLGEDEQETFRTLLRRLAGNARPDDPISEVCGVVEDLHPDAPAWEMIRGPRRRRAPSRAR